MLLLPMLMAAAASAADVAPAAEASAKPPAPAAKPAKVVVIPIQEQIAKPILYLLRRGLKEAISQGADTVVLDMKTPGGELGVTYEMLEAIGKFPGKTVTYVNNEAMSAGAFISAATDEIHFSKDGIIGAAAPVSATGEDINKTMNAKILSYLKARVRSMSEGKGYRGQVISAMTDIGYELKIGDEVIKAKDEGLLSLTAQEAMKPYGDPATPLLGAGISNSLEELLDHLHGRGNYSVHRLEPNWGENLAQYLTNLAPLLMALGMLCIFIEFKTPGFGLPGIAGGILLGLVFFGHFAAGLSGHEPAIFFLIGVILLVVEVFFFPGTAVMAVAGLTLMLGSLVWSMADLWPNEPVTLSGDVFLRPLMNVLVGVTVAVLAFLALLRFLPEGGPWSRLVLQTAVRGEPAAVRPLIAGPGEKSDAKSVIGQTGVTVTPLFPSGQVELAGRRYEARLAMGCAEAGVKVVVTGHAEFGLIVEPVPS
jgi:membrane-bound serine protease (ClpP class)